MDHAGRPRPITTRKCSLRDLGSAFSTAGAGQNRPASQSNEEDAMNQSDKAGRFAELHVKGRPVLLYNAWDAGSAKAILAADAQAIATSSWSVAEAQGYRDGEAIPIALAEEIVGRIAATTDAPVTVDFEGGYSEDNDELAGSIARLLD